MKKRLDELISFFRPSLFASLLFIIGTSNSELRAADENPKTLGSLVSDVEELNEVVYRYQLAGGWFSESDNAKLILTRLAMANGDFGLPRLVNPREEKFTAITAEVPPQNQKWVYWNTLTRRFQLWTGVAPNDVQIVTGFQRGKDKIFTAKVGKYSFKKKAAKAN